MSSRDEHPLVEVFRYRDELSAALSQQKWKRARSRAIRVRKCLDKMLAAHYKNYEGLFCVGEVAISKAPEDTKKAVLRMNEVIRLATKPQGKKKKKKS